MFPNFCEKKKEENFENKDIVLKNCIRDSLVILPFLGRKLWRED